MWTSSMWTSYSTEATGVNLSETGADSSIDFSTLAISNNSENDTFFQFFYCGGSRDFLYTCYKYQPATGSDGNPRFAAGNNASGIIFINSADEVYIGTAVVLAGAMGNLAMSLAAVVSTYVAFAF